MHILYRHFEDHSPVMTDFKDKWQKAKATIRGRGVLGAPFLFNNHLLSDVNLVVRSSTNERDRKKTKTAIPAHKFVLSICSPVFCAMFCGKMAEKSDYIDLPDCEYEAVLEMLRYLYSEEVHLSECNVMPVLYVAEKYILPSLADECIDFLLRNMDSTNVFCILSHAQKYDKKNLLTRCWEKIDRDTEDVLKSEGFMTIERCLLEAIVKRDSLTIREVELLKAVDLWAAKECERQGIAVDGNGKRRVIGEQIVKAIRFPSMEEREFVSTVLDCKILCQEEVENVMKNFNGELSTPVDFPVDRRTGCCYSCSRFDSHFTRETGLCYLDNNEEDCILFSVDNDIMLHGIRMFGSKDQQYSVFLTVEDFLDDEVLLDTGEQEFSSLALPCKEKKLYGFDIWFDPVVARKNTLYLVKAFIIGLDSCCGHRGVDTVRCQDVTFFFESGPLHDDKTTVGHGQFAEFFFKLI